MTRSKPLTGAATLFEKRRKLMEAWANFCARPTTTGKVVAFGR